MNKKFYKIIELPCEESSKGEIKKRLLNYLADKQDYINGNVVIDTSGFEAVRVVIYDGCNNLSELVSVLY